MRRIFQAVVSFVFVIMALPVEASLEDAPRVVSLRPEASILSGQATVPARLNMTLQPGDEVETGPHGRISLLLPDHTLMKIYPNTRFTYEGMDDRRANWLISRGRTWLRGLFRQSDFHLRTPTAVLGVRGTEWFLDVKEDGATTVGTVDGRVEVSNQLGRVELGARETATVREGVVPVKSAYLMPADAVNWTLKYRGFWSTADIGRGGPDAAILIRAALDTYERNNLAAAHDALNDLASAAPDAPVTKALAGFLALVSGNDKDARRHFTDAAAADPEWALPPAHLALMDVTENRLDEARRQAELALSVEPDGGVAHIAMAYVLKAGLKPREGYEHARRAVSLDPDFTAARLVAAELALEMEDLRACRRILAGIPVNTAVESQRRSISGFLVLREGNNRSAQDHFRAAVEADPDQSDAWLGLGVALFNLNQEEEGIDAIVRACLIAPQVSAYQSYLAKAYFELNRGPEGMASVRRAMRLDPRDPTPYLYESLRLSALHRPGEAIRALQQALERNDNRAVFRSRYLLDQDAAVLTANVARIYSDLGFANASVREAAQALERNPANEGAHRRLFFAMNSDPEGVYSQAAFSARLLAKLFVSPTREGVVFDEGSLAPYQPMFARSGMDGALAGIYFQTEGDDSKALQTSGAAALAGKFDQPLAVYAQVNSGKMDTDIRTLDTTVTSPYATQTGMKVDQEQQDLYTTAFVKWNPRPFISLFAEAEYIHPEIDVDSRTVSITTAPGMDPVEFVSTSPSTTDVRQRNFDTGMHLDFQNGAHGLFHFSHHDNPNTADLETRSPGSMVSVENEADNRQRIYQAAFWKQWTRHHLKAGFRSYTETAWNETNAISETRIVLPPDYYTTFEPTEYAFVSENRNRISTQARSGNTYLLHRYQPWEPLAWTWGGAFTSTRFEAADAQTLSTDGFHPLAGLTWRMTPNWRLRMAHIENVVGDRNERLQPALVAGFPLLKGGTAREAYTAEQILNLKHRTSSAGLDFQLTGFPFFCGVEAALDRETTRSFDPGDTSLKVSMENDIVEFRGYVETLLHTNLSLGLVCDHARYEHPLKSEDTMFTGRVAYFTPFGLAFKLTGRYKINDPDTTSSRFTRIVEPEILWHAWNNRIDIGVKGRHEKQVGGGIDDGETHWIRIIVAVHL